MPVELQSPPVSAASAASELTRLAQAGDTIVVRNTQSGIVVFTDDQSKQHAEWQGAGDPNGGDVKQVSAVFLQNPAFRETLLRKILVVDDAPEILEDALAAQKAEWDARQQSKADAQASLSRIADRTVTRGQSCIATTGPRGELCGIVAAVGQNPNEKPPLCTEHMNMVNLYVPSSNGTDADGKEKITWSKLKVGSNRR